MKKFKKFLRELNDFTFNVLIGMTLVWGMYLSIVLTIEIPVIGIPILALSIFIAILMKKENLKQRRLMR